MITQPELGSKILELRLAKGLTQTELAESCNLSLRTIQRIEAAEVIPRAYTLRQIFEALGRPDYLQNYSVPAGGLMESLRNRFGAKIQKTSHLTLKQMRIVIAFSVLIGSLGLAFFGISAYINAKKYSKNGTGIQGIQFDFISHFNAGQIEQIGSVFLHTASMMPVNHKEIHGREEIVDYYQSVYDLGFRMVSDEISSTQITDSVAIQTGNWTGWNRQEYKGSYIAQWKKVGGKWYIEKYMTNYSREY